MPAVPRLVWLGGPVVVGFALACGTSPTAAPPPPAPPVVTAPVPVPVRRSARVECRGKGKAAADLFDAGSKKEASEAFQAAYDACGPSYGFLNSIGFIRADQGDLEGAAAAYLQEVSEPGPSAEVFGNLEAIRDKLSPETRARIAALGADADHPVHVRGVDGEYSWAHAFTCLGASETSPATQSMAKGPNGTVLDRLEFTCVGDGSKHVVFFDFGGL